VRAYDYDPAQAEADKDKRHELTQKKNQLLVRYQLSQVLTKPAFSAY